MKISIITPTFNRAHLLHYAYNSLRRQDCKSFEWIIVDDGSTDNTFDICRSFSINDFKIRYIRKENGGKHTAINVGVKEAKGDFCLILDSDDSLPYNAIRIILSYCQQINLDTSFGGVAGYMAHHDGNVIGHGCIREIIDTNSIDIRYKYHLQGDMCEIFRTKVLQEFPFPEIKGERFCPEVLVWNRIAQKYKLRYFPEVVYYRDYLDGGLTDNIIRIRMKSPILTCTCYAEMNKLDIPFRQRMKSAINYWRFRLCATNKKNKLPKIGTIWFFFFPIGLLIHIFDIKKVER